LSLFALVAIVIFTTAVLKARRQHSSIQFDPSAWKWNEWSTERKTMLVDLQRKHVIVGMTKDEVIQLLGKPQRVNRFSDADFSYFLGPESGWFGIDAEWLTLDLKNDKVVQVRLTTD
jgi:hypothetical protein